MLSLSHFVVQMFLIHYNCFDYLIYLVYMCVRACVRACVCGLFSKINSACVIVSHIFTLLRIYFFKFL